MISKLNDFLLKVIFMISNLDTVLLYTFQMQVLELNRVTIQSYTAWKQVLFRFIGLVDCHCYNFTFLIGK